MKKKKKNESKKRKTLKDFDQRMSDFNHNPKTKKILNFNQSLACSIQPLTVTKNNVVKPTSRFFNSKMLLFVKLLLKSCIYELAETFYFPNKTARTIYDKNKIERVFPYHVLTDADITCIMFLFIFKIESKTPDDECINVIFEVLVSSNIINKFETSHAFWEKHNIRNENLKRS